MDASSLTKDSHCGYCGAKFTEQVVWPRTCFICFHESYKNPIPIIVSMVQVKTKKGRGVLIQQRNIEPQKGLWALPGGYINHGETWQEAAARENEEEMNLKSSPDDYNLFDILNSTNGNMLIFCEKHGAMNEKAALDLLNNFKPNEEVMALDIYYNDGRQLAFPTHNECASLFLEMLK